MRKVAMMIVFGLMVVSSVRAQHDHGRVAKEDTARAEQQAMPLQEISGEQTGMHPSSMVLPGVPMQRDGSGASWLPDASPMYAVHARGGAWSLMFHGSLFLRYNAQDAFESGTRGSRQFGAPNWFMGMAQRPLGRTSQLAFRGMFSFDRLTEGGRGYPLLFQTGETFAGKPLIDRQHPHDLFSELAVAYGQSLSEQAGFFAYFGLPGEPALGPPAFMHRTAGLHNPNSPLGHHWQDATHILFGVATLGVRYGPLKLDGSVFNGREPDEDRYNIDLPRFNSYSLRLSANPSDRWALQASRGFLKRPEVLHPDEDQWRTTASALYAAPLKGNRYWSTGLVWGMNEIVNAHEEEEQVAATLHSFLVESDLQLGRQAFYGRAEWVEKPAEELGLTQFDHDRSFSLGALTLGTARTLLTVGGFMLELGGHGILYRVPEAIESIYGSSPVSLEVYLRLSPTRLQMGRGSMHEGAGNEMHRR